MLKKVIIVPDIHGRSFWKCDDVMDNLDRDDAHIVFLGDYLDSYGFEFITREDAIGNFAEIIETAKKHDNVTLLLGNHDLHYYPALRTVYGCRRYDSVIDKVGKMFTDESGLFSIAFETEANGRRHLFTHAGVLDGWLKFENRALSRKDKPIEMTAESLNSLDLVGNTDDIYALWAVPEERGGTSPYGSCVWADVSEHFYETESKSEGPYQIFAHSLSYPTVYDYAINKDWAMLDCRKVFTLNCETGVIGTNMDA